MTAISGTALPRHGRVDCTACHAAPVTFDVTRREQDGWRITANPLSWGNERPKVLVLGFSKGPTQAGALASEPHDDIAYKKGRAQAYRILARVGLVPPSERPREAMDRLIADRNGAFAFGSLVRCTVERWDSGDNVWKGSGGGMLDRFAATPFGREVVGRCAARFLANLPEETRLVLMFGMGSELNYVGECERAIHAVRRRPGWRRYDDVSYGDDVVTFVHVEHFASQGALIPNWLGDIGADGEPKDPKRVRLASLSAAAVRRALADAP
jgi:hypothetical protein